MNKTFTKNDIIKILNSIQLRDIDSGSDFQLGHTVVKSDSGDMVYVDDIATAFDLDFSWNDGRMTFVDKYQ
jgi:DNA/RNA-binding domain of Phe-tRNA-synthetase-like protein